MAKQKKKSKSPSRSDVTVSALPEKHMIGISIDPNGKKTKVKLTFAEDINSDVIEKEPLQPVVAGDQDELTMQEATGGEEIDGAEEETAESSGMQPEHSIKSPFMPRKEFLNAMKKLRKHALSICGMEEGTGTEGIKDYTVSAIKIAGNHNLKQSRVIMTVTKTSQLTGKEIKFTTPQVSLYGDKAKYPESKALAKDIEAVVDLAWNYMGGDYAESDGTQLALFERVTLNLK